MYSTYFNSYSSQLNVNVLRKVGLENFEKLREMKEEEDELLFEFITYLT